MRHLGAKLDELAAEVESGAIVGVAELVDCQPAETLASRFPDPLHQASCIFGFHGYGGYGWVMERARPAPYYLLGVRGRHRLWDLPGDLAEWVRSWAP